MRRVFLSHSSKDKVFVGELYRRLTRDGVNCFYDAESIGWGDNWVRALERALDECSDIVFVLSPDFCDSEWVEVERTSSIADDPSGLKRKVRPLLLHKCKHLPTFPRFLRNVQMLDVSTTELFEKNYPKICTALGGTVVPGVANLDRAKLPPVHPLPARHRMPYRSLGDGFVGRLDALWEIHDAMHRDNTAIVQGVGVVAGTGGLGKTQAAIEYAHRFGAGYPGGVYWVDSDRGLATLVTQVSEAAEIGIDTGAKEEEQLARLWKELNKLPPSLLILDNFPEEIALRPYLPTTGRIHTLVTTRRRDLSAFPNVRLNVLSGDAGIALLNSGVRKLNRDDAAVLVQRLGGLPLALELTRSFLNYRQNVGVPQLLAEMARSGEMEVLRGFAKKYRDELPSGHETDVARTFQTSWNVAPRAAQDVLRVMADLAPAGVPRVLIRQALDLPGPAGFDDGLEESFSELIRLSLVEVDVHGDPLMHRLVHAFVRDRNRHDRVSFFERTAAAILNRMQATFDNPDAAVLRQLDSLVPHADVLLASGRLADREATGLLGRLGNHHLTMGRLSKARHFSAAALERAEKSFRVGHPSIAISQSILALVLKDLGQRKEARGLLRKALASAEKSFEPGHPSIARCQSNLALVLQDLGQREEARDLLRKALASDEKNFEPGNPSIATSQSNLAMVLKDLGQREEARDLLRKALASDEKSFEPGHSSIATSQSNLALVLQDLGQLEEARDLLRKALASAEKSFEPGHPTIAIRQSNLAMVLRDLGQPEEARDLLRKALASDEKSFEPGHPSIAIDQSILASVLQDLGQLEEARDLLQRAQAKPRSSA
jgi:tetratricopeptide (TPR) repeat protein